MERLVISSGIEQILGIALLFLLSILANEASGRLGVPARALVELAPA